MRSCPPSSRVCPYSRQIAPARARNEPLRRPARLRQCQALEPAAVPPQNHQTVIGSRRYRRESRLRRSKLPPPTPAEASRFDRCWSCRQRTESLRKHPNLSLIHISEPTSQAEISYAVFCLKKKKRV